MKRLFNTLLVVAVTSLALTTVSAAANEATFEQIATEILSGLENTSVNNVPANSGYGAPKISLYPLARGLDPVTADVARGYNRQLLVELKRQSAGRFHLMARDSIDRLIGEIEAEGLSLDETQSRIADLRANSRADILITGTIYTEGNATILSYQAISSNNGNLLAATSPRRLSQPLFGSSPVITSYLNTGATGSLAVADLSADPMHPPAGNYRPTVEEAERELTAQGYDPGPVDGYLTEKTRQALRDYQRDSALPMNGRLTRRVVSNLRRDTR